MLIATLVSLALLAPADTLPAWRIDVNHSEVSFRIRHLVSRVRGTFRTWEGTISADPTDWAGGAVEVTIQAGSIDTGNERRDNDLRSSNFFDVATWPTLRFRSTRVEVNGESLRLTGELTIRDVTRSIVLEGSLLGVTPSGQGGSRAGFEVRGKLNRLDYGVTWNRVVEGGGVLLGDEVEIEITVAAVHRPT